MHIKGIYPRVPTKAPKGSDKIYYDIKDVAFLSHEPLLKQFREFKTFMRKLRREAGRYQFAEARRKNALKPKMILDHLVKERYPRFIDALRDMDDTLCMIHLFASLPATGRVTAERTRMCNELVQHWQYYVARTRSLQKSFISIKGVYFQCEILGEPITWIVPHKFTQSIPREVDIRVMTTFLEFYEVFLRFVLFKLYSMQGLKYPPQIDKSLSDAGCFLLSIKAAPLEGTTAKVGEVGEAPSVVAASAGSSAAPVAIQGKKKTAKDEKLISSLNAKLDKIASNDESEDDEDSVPIAGALTEAFAGLYGNELGHGDEGEEERKLFASPSEDIRSSLFSRLKFFINREVPLDWMQLCIISFGGQVGWEDSASPYSVDDAGITHHVIDRPIQGNQTKTREYVQPQWVFDCINAQMLLPVQKYRPGCLLPPHLSPFVDNEKEGYTPKYSEELSQLRSSLEVKEGAAVVSAVASSAVASTEQDDSDDEDEHQETIKAEKKKSGSKDSQKKSAKANVKKVPAKEELSSDDEDSEGESQAEADENYSTTKGPKGVVFQPKKSNKTEDEESAELSRIMMSKKSKRLYGRMQHGIQQKKNSVQTLIEKRKLLEAGSEDTSNQSKAPAVAAGDKKQKKSKK